MPGRKQLARQNAAALARACCRFWPYELFYRQNPLSICEANSGAWILDGARGPALECDCSDPINDPGTGWNVVWKGSHSPPTARRACLYAWLADPANGPATATAPRLRTATGDDCARSRAGLGLRAAVLLQVDNRDATATSAPSSSFSRFPSSTTPPDPRRPRSIRDNLNIEAARLKDGVAAKAATQSTTRAWASTAPMMKTGCRPVKRSASSNLGRRVVGMEACEWASIKPTPTSAVDRADAAPHARADDAQPVAEADAGADAGDAGPGRLVGDVEGRGHHFNADEAKKTAFAGRFWPARAGNSTR